MTNDKDVQLRREHLANWIFVTNVRIFEEERDLYVHTVCMSNKPKLVSCLAALVSL